MFDLFRSREKSVRILLGALLVLVAFSMLTYLVPNYNSDGSSSSAVVARVGKDDITLPEVQRLIQNAMRGRNLPPDLVSTYIPQIVDQLVTDRALAYQAAQLGLQVSDEDLRQAIQQYLPQLFPDGKFAGKESYAAVLGQQELTIQDFESDLRRQILISKLRDIALEGTVVSPLEIEHAYKERNEKVKIQYVKLTGDKYKAEVQPSAEDMQAFFKANQARYQAPEKKNLAILIADQAKIAESLPTTDADLLKLYNQNKEQFRTPERVQARHILLMTQGKPPADDAKIKAQADDLLKQVKAGGNFAELAKKFSGDPGSAAKGGDLGWIQRGQMVPEFEKATFALKPNEISGVIKTEYGYHIIQVQAHEDAHLQTFEEVKTQLAAQAKNSRINAIMQQISDQAQSALAKDPLHPDQVAAQFHMQVVRADNVEPGKPVPEIGTSSDFDQSLTGLKQGQVSQPVALPGNKLALAVVTGIVPARPNTFAEVETQVRDAIVQNRMQVALRKHADELAAKAKATGDLASAAKSLGLELKSPDEFNRVGAVEGLGSASYVQEAFARPDGTVIGPIQTPDGTLVVKVIAHIAPDQSKLAEQRGTIRDEIKTQKARERNTLFETGLRETLQKQGKLKYHQDVISRLVAQYRTTS